MGMVVSFQSPARVTVEPEPERPIAAGEVRLATLYSGISAGTELASYRGTNPHLTREWDADLRLFGETPAVPAYPMSGFGYEEVGEVVEIAPEVDSISVGDRVWGTWGHRTSTVVSADFASQRILDPHVDPRIGIFSHIGAIALNAVLDADIHIGETVVVFGLGVPGQIVAQLARLNGGRVIVVDGIAARRELALELGASHALDPASGTVARDVKDLTGGRGADVAIEISGNYRALSEAIRTVAYNARVCVSGFFQGEAAGLNLGEEFHMNRIQLVGSQISGVSAHLQHRWDRYRLTSTAIDLAATGRLKLVELISHTVALRDVGEAYRMLDEAPQSALQVVLDMRGDGDK